MPTCAHCKNFFFDSVLLLKHLRFKLCRKLDFHDPQFKQFLCGEEGCKRYYPTGNSFLKHLRREHRFEKIDSNNEPAESPNSLACEPSTSSLINDTQQNFVIPNEEKCIGSLISSLYSNPLIPRNCIQIIMHDFQLCFDAYNLSLSKKLSTSLINDHGIIPSVSRDIISNVLGSQSEVTALFKSEHMRFKFFETLGTFIKPVQYSVGSRREYRQNRILTVPCHIQVIPIDKVFVRLFSMKGILTDILDYMRSLEQYDEPVVSLIQSRVWRQKVAKYRKGGNELHLPIIVYYDDVEVNNPLSSHASIHKLGATYIGLPFLPKNYSSLLNCILMISLCHASDRVTLGNRMIFSKVIEMLNVLSETGIEISTEEYSGSIKFHTVCLTGDNLGLNGILGFVESFSAHYCCRFCTMKRDNMSDNFVEDTSLLRTPENYNAALSLEDCSKTGVKEKSVWFDLKSFDFFNDIGVDFLHDYLEGVCRYTLSFVVKNLMKSDFFNIVTLQSQIASFGYGPDSSTKPLNAIVSEGSEIKIKTSASEMLTFVRYFPLIVGFYVPEGHKVWGLLLLLRELLEKLLCYRVYPSTNEQLQVLITGFLSTYRAVTNQPLTPKFHFLTHYPRLLEYYGPLQQLWTMRFEAKHRVSKIAARTSSSRVNICKTLALRNQLTLNNLFLKADPFPFFHCGKRTTLKTSMRDILFNQFPYIQTANKTFSVKWFKKNGVRIEEESIMTLDISLEEGDPIFARVLKIYITEPPRHIFLKCIKLPLVAFNEHYFSFEVNIFPPDIMYVDYDRIQSPIPNTLTTMPDFKHFVTLRSALD